MPWSAPTAGVPSFSRLHALYLSALGAPEPRVIAAVKLDQAHQRRYASLLGHSFQTPNELGLPPSAAAASASAAAASAGFALNDDLDDVSDILNLASPYPLLGSPVANAGPSASLAVALASPATAALAPIAPHSSLAHCALTRVPGGDGDDGGVLARCGIVTVGSALALRSAAGDCGGRALALCSGGPSRGEYAGFGSGSNGNNGNDISDNEDDIEMNTLNSTTGNNDGTNGNNSRGYVKTMSLATTMATLKMSSPVANNDSLTISTSQLCSTCRIVRPLRSKHCPKCHRCVAQFDHHCPFLGTDIGAGNHNSFFWFCTAMAGVNFIYPLLYTVYLMHVTDAAGLPVGWLTAAVARPLLTLWVYHHVIYLYAASLFKNYNIYIYIPDL